jgi:N-acetylglucosaminyldiphosphoundecaprenol N-acetyl-beta-D-mannosaminyltransferase
LNPHSYAVALEDPAFRQALEAADWLIPDGAGIVLASRALGGQIRKRVTGSDIFHALNTELARFGGSRVFLLGATEETLGEIHRRMAQDFPDLQVVGSYAPPFREAFSIAENEAIVRAINAARADVLWVGMSAP